MQDRFYWETGKLTPDKNDCRNERSILCCSFPIKDQKSLNLALATLTFLPFVPHSKVTPQTYRYARQQLEWLLLVLTAAKLEDCWMSATWTSDQKEMIGRTPDCFLFYQSIWIVYYRHDVFRISTKISNVFEEDYCQFFFLILKKTKVELNLITFTVVVFKWLASRIELHWLAAWTMSEVLLEVIWML